MTFLVLKNIVASLNFFPFRCHILFKHFLCNFWKTLKIIHLLFVTLRLSFVKSNTTRGTIYRILEFNAYTVVDKKNKKYI